MSNGSDKKAQALESLRKAAQQLLEDTVEGHPTKRLHTHVYTILNAVEPLIESLSPVGARERDTSEDAPSQADPEKWPGGRHRKTKIDGVFEDMVGRGWDEKPSPEFEEMARSSLEMAGRHVLPCQFYATSAPRTCWELLPTRAHMWCPNCQQRSKILDTTFTDDDGFTFTPPVDHRARFTTEDNKKVNPPSLPDMEVPGLDDAFVIPGDAEFDELSEDQRRFLLVTGLRVIADIIENGGLE